MGAPQSVYSDDWRGKWSRLVAYSRSEFAPEMFPLPTDAQMDLLKAALLPAEQAAPAWRRWKARGLDLQTVRDEASTRVFPQLLQNRDAAEIGAEDLPILKGVRRHTTAANVAILASALKVAQLFRDAGIPHLLFKGAAMIARVDRLGYRRIADVDVLVPRAYAERAGHALLAAGYTAKPPHRPIGFSHARGYRLPSGQEVDLHWWAFKTAGDDSSMFDTAEPATLLGTPVLIPSPTECLISAIGNAFQMWGAPRLRWISDAVVLLGQAEIDWEYLLERTKRSGLTLSLASGLGFLYREFDAPIPAYVLDELSGRRVNWSERAAFWVAVHRPPVGATVVTEWDRHRARRSQGDAAMPPDFLWRMAQLSGRPRRDVVRRALRTVIRAAAVLAIRYSRPRRRRREISGYVA